MEFRNADRAWARIAEPPSSAAAPRPKPLSTVAAEASATPVLPGCNGPIMIAAIALRRLSPFPPELLGLVEKARSPVLSATAFARGAPDKAFGS
jgi:hypothetical protein